MNNKAFIRMLEVIISSLLMIGLLTWMSNQAYEPSIKLKTNLNQRGNLLISMLHESGVLEQYLENFDLLGMDSITSYLLPVRISHKIEVTYSTSFELQELNGIASENNYSLTYNFPTSVDKNSVILSDGDELLPRNVLFNSYEIIFSFENNRSNALSRILGFNDSKGIA